ncbi:MAG: serine/threonine protein kinase [Gemmatimonadetes bacterium]|nr:serine/threonine protein kinase [Gemmatimonadota bacterium]
MGPDQHLLPPLFDQALAALPAALAGEFELEREIGRGGMGVVYLARDLMLDRQVALKVLPPGSATSEVRERFLREARTAGQLSHPHIVHIHRADQRGDFAFFVMGLVDGENLGQRVRDRGPLPAADAVRHLREVAWALAYAHARGVIHRDVKPENIMIERGTNRALVTDFGIARSERSPSMTGEGHVVGTAHYMSPEQVQGTALDGRSDLYALGCVGYFLLSGRVPFEGAGATAVLVAHVTRPAPPLLSVAPQVPQALAAVIDRCLSKDPAERFATGEELSEALRRAMEGAVAAREPVVVSGGHRVLSEEQAGLVWHRAAQLQAEAAARLERETRTHAARALGPGSAAEKDPSRNAGETGVGTSTYRLQDVEAAAVEAGISQRFVALALSELPRDGAAPLPLDSASTRGRMAQRLFGDLRPALSVSRIIRAPARDVLKLIGRTFQGTPYLMTLRDQIGPHPLDGGIIVFKLPDMDWSGQTRYPFTMLRYGFYAPELRVTLRVLDHDQRATEVTAVADLRPGHGVNVWGYGLLSGGVTATAGGVGALIGVKAMALAGVLIAAPAAITGLAVGGLALAGSRASYRWSLRKATTELEELLAAIDVSLRSRSIFDEDPPLPPPPQAGTGTGGNDRGR